MIPIAIAGFGKIARDEHLPAILQSSEFELAALVTREQGALPAPPFRTLAEAKAAVPSLAAVAICSPPQERFALVRDAAALGLHVMLEKPPSTTLGEARLLVATASGGSGILFVSWHARTTAGVSPARTWLAERSIHSIGIRWTEDVRTWHPGQEWIWAPGIGVFDPGINAVSLVTRLLDERVIARGATLFMPENRHAPLAADVQLESVSGVPIAGRIDMGVPGPHIWEVEAITDRGALKLTQGGSGLWIDGERVRVDDPGEYPLMYRHFAKLIANGRSETDLTPLELVADLQMIARRQSLPPFA